MITTKDFTSQAGATVTVKYPTGTIFMRERNYLTVSCKADDYYLKRITLAGKTINFGRYKLQDGQMTLDVSPYYAKLYKGGNLSLVVENQNEVDETFTVSFTINKVDGYSPFLEFVPERCGDAPYARIVPPNRMLWDGVKKSASMLAAVRDSDRFSGYEYEMDDVPYVTYRPSDAWLTNAQKNAHLGETYRNTLPATGNLAELDSNGLPLWIEQGLLLLTEGYSFGEQRSNSSIYCRAKTIFKNYNGLTIGDMPNGCRYFVLYYDTHKKYIGRDYARGSETTLNNAATYPYISLLFDKVDGEVQLEINPSELVGITSSALTNPEAGKSYRWVIENNKYKWLELTAEQLINERFMWSINGQNDANKVLNKPFDFGNKIDANLVFEKVLSPTGTPPSKFEVLQSVKRSVSLADGSLPYVYIRWRTPWGITVEHLFYLGSYSSDKSNAKELESVNYYEELSQHVRTGSFYLDGITQPYDLFYYKTLENAELVEMYFPSYAFKPNTYMPNGDTYVAIKIKGSDVADAVVDGVAKKNITFKFELS